MQKIAPSGQVLDAWELAWGSDEDIFNEPSGIARDADENIYVADSKNDRIQKFDPDGNFILAWGASGTGPSQFDNPTSLATDMSEYVYVCDRGNRRIQKFDSTGVFQMEFGGAGGALSQFTEPRGIAIDFSGMLLVADGRYLKRFSPSGVFHDALGDSTTSPGLLVHPIDVVVGSDGTIYVLDDGLLRIVEFSSDGSPLASHVSIWNQFGLPSAIGIDADDDIYVVDRLRETVDKFDEADGLLCSFGGWGTRPGKMQGPSDCVVDPSGIVYVADTGNHRIQRFVPDHHPPRVLSIERLDASPTNQAEVRYSIVFSEPVTGVDRPDFDLYAEGVVGPVISKLFRDVADAAFQNIAAASATYTVSVSTGTGDGTLRLNVVDDNSIEDEAENAPGGPGVGDGDYADGSLYVIDKSPPLASVTSPTEAIAKISPIPVTIAFGERVVDIDATKISVTRGTVNNFKVGRQSCTFDLVPKAIGAVSLNIAPALAHDLAGNSSGGPVTFSRIYASHKPTVSMTCALPDPTSSRRILVAITFSDPVLGFDGSDLLLTNCTLVEFRAIDKRNSVATVRATEAGVVGVRVPRNIVQSFSGQNNQPGRFRIGYLPAG